MENKPDNIHNSKSLTQVHPLKAMSAPDFAALGGNQTVFVRSISAGQLSAFIPEANTMPEDAIFQLIMAADGAPMLVADNPDAVADWLAENDVIQVMRH
jgi:hypothetical protein